MAEPAAEDIIPQHWPINDPYDPERTRSAAAAGSQLAFYLACATEEPSTPALTNRQIAVVVDDVMTSLRHLASTMRHLGDQVTVTGGEATTAVQTLQLATRHAFRAARLTNAACGVLTNADRLQLPEQIGEAP